MSFETLQLRLSALQETNTQIEELIHRLGTLKFQPGSIPLEGSDGDVSQELSEEISELMKEQAEELEILELEVGDLPAGNSRSSSAAVSAAVQERSVLIGGVNRANEVLRKWAPLCKVSCVIKVDIDYQITDFISTCTASS